VYITGQYLLNDHISISGTAYKQFDILNTVPGTPGYRNYSPQGAFMTVKYRVNNFVTFEAGVGYSQGASPYGNPFCSPYGTSSMFSPDPFRPSMFHP
jgi:hypothetical protein